MTASFLVLAILTTGNAFRHQREETAWDVLCLAGQAGEFRRWSENDCSSVGAALNAKQCHSLNIKCDVDVRVKDIDITWRVTGTVKELKVPKTATSVTAKEARYSRFFVASSGCPQGSDDADCGFTWQPFEAPREATTSVAVKRTFLVYDARVAGKPVIRMEKHKYQGTFYASEFRPLGVGIPVPEEATFAGSTGTDCAAGRGCAEPPRTVEPVPEKNLDVTSRYLMESLSRPGAIVLMSNRNTASVESTYIKEFSLDEKRT